jgi:hypothetical protein
MDEKTSGIVGDPDFRVYGPENRVAFVEMKVRPNRLTDAQTCRVAELQRAGCQVCVAYDLETAIHHLATIFVDGVPAHEIKTETASVREPKIYLVQSSAGFMVVRQDGETVTIVRPATKGDMETIPLRTNAIG